MDSFLNGFFEEITFGFSTFATLVAAGMYSKYKSISQNLEAAPVVTVGTNLTTSMKTQDTIPYAVLTGRVFPQEPEKVLQTLSGMNAVIAKQSVTEFRLLDIFNSFMPNNLIEVGNGKISPSINYVPFGLVNPNGGKSNLKSDIHVLVDDISNGEFDNLLLVAKSTYTPAEITFTGLLASFLRGFHSVGIETSESVLPVGTVITVIGEVTKVSGGQFRIAKSFGGETTPYILTTKNIIDIKGNAQAHATAFKALAFLCGCFAILSFYTLGKKWLPRFRMRRVQQIILRQRSITNTDGLHETQICLACLQNPREVALFPCGHVCVCADCSLLINEKCPVCRENVVEIVPVYLA